MNRTVIGSSGSGHITEAVGVDPPVVVLLPHASRKAVRALAESPIAPARLIKSRRLCGENSFSNNSSSRLCISEASLSLNRMEQQEKELKCYSNICAARWDSESKRTIIFM